MPVIPPPAVEFASWSEAAGALHAAFVGGPVGTEGASGFALVHHDAAGCHFQDDGPGPDYTLLGIDWTHGLLRWGSLYMPKQDGGYSADAPLPESWLAPLHRLRERTWREHAPRFATPADAGPSLLATADPERRGWVQTAWHSLPGPRADPSVAPETVGVVDVLFAPCGHPLDVVVLCLDRVAATVAAALIDAEGRIEALGRAPLPAGLRGDLEALGPAASAGVETTTGWPARWAAEAVTDGTLAAAIRTAARDLLAAAAPADPCRGPIADFVGQFGPTRWFLPAVEIAWSGPAWHYEAGVPRSTVYGRFRLTCAWVGVAFTADFERVEFVENIMGPRPARVLGAFAVPDEWWPVLDAAYRARS